MPERELRAAIEKRRRRPLREEIWDQLVEEGYEDEWGMLSGDSRKRLLLEAVRRAREVERTGGLVIADPEEIPSKTENRRAWILSLMSAQDARRRPDVRRFRKGVLEDRFLSIEDIPEWIEARRGELGPHAERLTIELPAGHRLVQERRDETVSWRVDPPLTLGRVMVAERRSGGWFMREGIAAGIDSHRPLLDFPRPGDKWVHRVPVREGSVLDRLRELSERLAADYSWQRAQAVAFVLTGAVPIIRHLTASHHIRAFGERGRGRGRSTITVTAESWVSPREVAGAYSRARREAGIKGSWPLRGRLARLMEFVIELDPDLKWREKMDLWNRKGARSQEERYEAEARFHRDYHRAMERIGPVIQIGSRALMEVEGEPLGGR